jgi:DNA (cytosine-5)-methyltransferase 1
MNYFSVCDGIGAAHAALLPLGYRCVGVSEIDKYCNQLIEQKYGFKNYGDMHKWTEWHSRVPSKTTIKLVIGGTPCQSFSIIGKRQGMAVPNGKLTIEFARFIYCIYPRWFVWENVPGALSVNTGHMFQDFLDYFSKCGYGVAWRVLDAQHFGVPQRRRRVFVVGCLGDPVRAGKILFDSETVPACPEKLQETKNIHARGTPRRYRNNSGACGTVMSSWSKGIWGDRIKQIVLDNGRPRKLTPLECERLMGFPDGYTAGFSDHQRYRMLGNSMVVPVISWIGKRILASEPQSSDCERKGENT